ncbi:NUDIX domain-containing protein [Nocardia wallacei]|uniref:NUDIX domain-containing protein n=1 Tax=Nocardia wallacei TaxID=480035 RepID=UPI002455B1B8|nr:NUDIX domain-containing protein [Nocardia wallacei]
MIQRFQVGVKAVITRGNRMLTVQHQEGFWDVPGGRIDGDETPDETLRREIAEELPAATNIRIGRRLGEARIPEVEFPDGSRLLLLYREVFATVPPGLSDEHTASRWVTPGEAMTMGAVVATAARLITEAGSDV